MAKSSFGTKITHGSLVGEVITYDETAIAEVLDISGPAMETGTVETTHHQSVGGVEEYLATTLNPGEVNFSINYGGANATHNATAGLLKWQKDRTVEYYKVEFPDGAIWAFQAIITGFNPGAPVKGKLSADVKMKLTGQVTFTSA